MYGYLSEVLGRSLFKLTMDVPLGDGGALWLAIKKKFCSSTAVSKLKVVMQFVSLDQGKNENIDDYHFRFSSLVAKFDILNIIHLAVFLKALDARFDAARATLVMERSIPC